MTQNFVDVSSYQGGIDFTQLDCDGVIIKVSGGTGYLNPYAAAQHASARAAGKIIRLYHFAHELGCQGSAAAEAAFFLQHAAPLMDGVEGLDLDWESDNQADTAWAREWLDTVAGSSPTTPYFYANLAAINAYDWTAAGVTNYPLWLAWYPYNTPQGWGPLSGLPALSHWAAPAIWQYTSAGRLNGWGGNLDLSIRYQAPGDTINPQSTPSEEDPLATLSDQDKINLFNALSRIDQAFVNPPDSFVKAVAKQVHTYIVPHFDPATGKDDGHGTTLATMVGYSDLQHTATRSTVPPAVLNQQFPLSDGTKTNLPGILDQIHAKPATVTNVTSAAAPVDVEALVTRLKAELPATVLAALATKLAN